MIVILILRIGEFLMKEDTAGLSVIIIPLLPLIGHYNQVKSKQGSIDCSLRGERFLENRMDTLLHEGSTIKCLSCIQKSGVAGYDGVPSRLLSL